MSELGEPRTEKPLDFLRAQMAAYCLVNNIDMQPTEAASGQAFTLDSDFEVVRDVPPSFGHLLRAFDKYEQGQHDIDIGLWRGAIHWLFLKDVAMSDKRIAEVIGIFGCRPDIIMKQGMSSFGEMVERFPFAEGFSIEVREENDAEEAFDGPGKHRGVLLTMFMSSQ